MTVKEYLSKLRKLTKEIQKKKGNTFLLLCFPCSDYCLLEH